MKMNKTDRLIGTTDNFVLYASIAVIILMAASFSLGRSYQKNNQKFIYHQVNVTGGGVALIVPSKWNVVPVWDRHGRNYMRPTDEEG